MSVKQIQPMRIQSIKASINASTEEISQGMDSIIEAPVTDNLESCAGLVKACMENLVETVDSLDEFMNKIAEAFQNMDEDLAGSIDGIMNKIAEGSIDGIMNQIAGVSQNKDAGLAGLIEANEMYGFLWNNAYREVQ